MKSHLSNCHLYTHMLHLNHTKERGYAYHI